VNTTAARRAVRQRARLAAHVMLALFILAVALTYKENRKTASHGLVVLTLIVVGLVVAQSLLHWWVRRTDRRLGAGLPRRVTHSARLGWRTVLGVPRAAFALVALAGAVVLALCALASPDGSTRYAGVVLLIGSGGVALAMLVQLRHVLTRPVVADDEASLDADLVMRVEDARDAAAPNVLWALPAASVLGSAIGWWNDAWAVFIVFNAVAYALVTGGMALSAGRAQRASSQATGGTVAQ
jgi:hypothetical protein